MPVPSIQFCAANPTFEEGRVFARYLDQAAEGFFRFMLGRRSVDILAAAFTSPGHDLSYQNVTFAERDKITVGMVSGYTAAQHTRSSDRPLRQAAGKSRLRMTLVSILFFPIFRVLDTVADDDFYLQAIAVDKAYRGEGLGSILMEFIENRARACGSECLSLDVSAYNTGARRLYEHRGMTVASMWPRGLTIPGLRLLRMAKKL